MKARFLFLVNIRHEFSSEFNERQKSERQYWYNNNNSNSLSGSVLTLRNDNITCYEKLSVYVGKKKKWAVPCARLCMCEFFFGAHAAFTVVFSDLAACFISVSVSILVCLFSFVFFFFFVIFVSLYSISWIIFVCLIVNTFIIAVIFFFASLVFKLHSCNCFFFSFAIPIIVYFCKRRKLSNEKKKPDRLTSFFFSFHFQFHLYTTHIFFSFACFFLLLLSFLASLSFGCMICMRLRVLSCDLLITCYIITGIQANCD